MCDTAKIYAEEVGSGDIMTGRAVRLACDRHLKDLERVGWGQTFPYYAALAFTTACRWGGVLDENTQREGADIDAGVKLLTRRARW